MHNETKFSEDVVPLGDLKINPGKVVKQLDKTGRPVLLTSHGRGVAVVQGLSDFEAAQEERAFMKAVIEGQNALDNGDEFSAEEVKARLGII